MTVPSGTPRRRRIWPYAPLALMLLLAFAWTGLWFYAARRAEGAVAEWMAREAQAGRLHACGSRAVGGYPFRIEIRCEKPATRLGGFGRPLTLQAESLLAVAQIYTPDLVVAELSGPLRLASEDGTLNLILDWKLLQASLRGFPGRLGRASVAVDGLTVNRPAQGVQAGSAAPAAEARHVELHLRQRPNAAEPVFDLAVRIEGAALPQVPGLAAPPVDVGAEAAIRGIADLDPKPFDRRLREWQAANGRLEVGRVRFAQGDLLAVAKGELGLTGEGRLDGSLQVMVAGIERLAALLLGGTDEARAQASLLGGLAVLAARGEAEGRPAVALPLRFANGAARLGPLQLGRIPPLY
ncbi:MAG TPA: DUF2125 domain-containing protein [Xanthobacteraceae bacterium]|nr:DUF2125 domain-containing protein [Xanthobacteraceae bacterium]